MKKLTEIEKLRKEVESLKEEFKKLTSIPTNSSSITIPFIPSGGSVVLSGENIYEAKPKPDFKVKDWVVFTPLGVVRRLTAVLNDTIAFDGMNQCEYPNVFKSYYRHATTEEIKNHLEKEAIKRGFKVGTEFKSPLNDTVSNVKNFKTSYDKENQFLFLDHNIIWYDGTWATIIDDAPVINGHKMEVYSNRSRVKFGCAILDIDDFTCINNAVNTFNDHMSMSDLNRTITSITLDSGVTITVDELKQIVEHLNKKK